MLRAFTERFGRTAGHFRGQPKGFSAGAPGRESRCFLLTLSSTAVYPDLSNRIQTGRFWKNSASVAPNSRQQNPIKKTDI